jgi:hypothetical protein
MGTWADVGAAGLGLPEPPEGLAGNLRELGDRRWGTRPGAPALRGIGWFVVEATEEAPPDYVLAGVEEVSTGLELIHEYLVCGPLGLFIQVRLDEPGRAALAAAGELQHSVLSPSFSPPDPVGRLVVVDTPLGSSSWEWTGLDRARGSGGAAEALRWVEACALGRDD